MGCKVVFESICFAEELSLMPITNWVIADLANKEGRALVKAALKQMVGKCVTVAAQNIFQVKRVFQCRDLCFKISPNLVFHFSV